MGESEYLEDSLIPQDFECIRFGFIAGADFAALIAGLPQFLVHRHPKAPSSS